MNTYTTEVTFRLNGSKEVKHVVFDSTDKKDMKQFKLLIDRLRAHEIGDGFNKVVRQGEADYFYVRHFIV